MIEFNVKYWSTYENKTKPSIINQGSVYHPVLIKWVYDKTGYEFVKDDIDLITNIYVSQEFILVCYYRDSIHFSAPNNLVLYNLEKEVVKIIPTPKSTNGLKMPITSMGSIKMIDGIKHISVRIDNTYFDGFGDVEIHYLNTNTFEYHPTFIEKHKEYGR